MAVNDQSEIILIPQGMLPWHQFLLLLNTGGQWHSRAG